MFNIKYETCSFIHSFNMLVTYGVLSDKTKQLITKFITVNRVSIMKNQSREETYISGLKSDYLQSLAFGLWLSISHKLPLML